MYPTHYSEMASADPLQLEMFLSKPSNIPIGKKGSYGAKCEDYISLTYTLIHSVRSVTLIKILHKYQNNKNCSRNNVATRKYTDSEESQECGVNISCDVSESVLCIVNAYAHCVVLPVLAGTVQWHILQLLRLREDNTSSDTTSCTTSLSDDTTRSSSFSSGTSR